MRIISGLAAAALLLAGLPGAAADDMDRVFAGDDYALTVHAAGRVASLESTTFFNNASANMSANESRDIGQRVYRHFKDDFDFIIVAPNQAVFFRPPVSPRSP